MLEIEAILNTAKRPEPVKEKDGGFSIIDVEC